MDCLRGPAPIQFVASGPYAMPPQGCRSGPSWCGAVVVFVLVLGLVWWLSSSGSGPGGASASLPLAQAQPRPAPPRGDCALPGGDESLYGAALRAPRASACSDSQPTPPHVVDSAPLGPTVPLDVGGHPTVASVGGLDLQSSDRGTSLHGAFDMTEAGKEFMQAYNPTGLASVMPAGWRAEKPACQNNGDAGHAEWSRYSLSPLAVARSENLKAVMRVSENTRQGLSRTLGQQSLLRNAVTPIGPQPIGSHAFIFQDSSVRQAYIAAATGSFPSVSDVS